MKRVSKSAFKSKALEYFRRIEATGESVIVTDRGRPTIEVRPYRRVVRDPRAILQGSVLDFHAATEPVGDSDWECAEDEPTAHCRDSETRE